MESSAYEAVSGECAGTEDVTASGDGDEKGSIRARRRAKRGGSRPGAGRPRQHALPEFRKTLRTLTTKRVDGRSTIAVTVRRWKDNVRRDLGGDLTRAQETILEAAAQAWIILASLDDYLARQPSLVARKRQVLPVVMQGM